MTLNEAHDILKHFSIWRTGKVKDLKYTPKQLGAAIDLILDEISEKLK